MSEMVERVALAMQEKAEGPTHGNFGERPHESYVKLARAAIAAMREPTEAMLERGDHGTSADGWAAMIDEALK